MVVEITPTGIRNLGWKFYIIWTVLNFSFVPTVYFFYPETAGRTLEDLDSYFRDQPGLLVFGDKSATSSKRPIEFIEREEQEVRRQSSVNPRAASLAAARNHSIDQAELGRVSSGNSADAEKRTELAHKETI